MTYQVAKSHPEAALAMLDVLYTYSKVDRTPSQ
jgi:hypothetical protein